MNIPFVDLKAQYLSIKNEIDAAIADTINNTAFIKSAAVGKFEAEFAKFIGTKHCVGCANGTDAIEVVLEALGIGRGDEVIVPARSWISTSEAVSRVGATPVFVDVDPKLYTIDPALIEAKITAKTKAIIPVHFHGLPAEMDEIMAIAGKHNLHVIEDTAQGHASTYKGKMTGTFGIAATFSFFPGKNLGAYGDAGGIVTNDDQLAKKCRMICDHGQEGKHSHFMEGRNSRLDGIQAAILLAKLPHLAAWTAARQRNAGLYDKALSRFDLQLPVTPAHSTHVFHLYVVQTSNREALIESLHAAGVNTAIHYPTALPFLKAYDSRGFKPQDFPVSHSQMSRILSLPMYPELEAAQVDYIADVIGRTMR